MLCDVSFHDMTIMDSIPEKSRPNGNRLPFGHSTKVDEKEIAAGETWFY